MLLEQCSEGPVDDFVVDTFVQVALSDSLEDGTGFCKLLHVDRKIKIR